MEINIRTRRMSIPARLRSRIEAYVQTALRREREHINAVALYISATPLAGSYTGFACRLVLHSSRAGRIVVTAEASRLTAALRQVTRRSRAVVRQRSKHTVDRYQGAWLARRRNSHERVEQWSS